MGKYQHLISRMTSSVDYWAQAAMRRFVLDIDRWMTAQNISRAELAKKLNTSPAYVTKAMRGDVNFTLETMTKFALAVGGRLQVRIVDPDTISEVNTNRVVRRAESPEWLSSVWHCENTKQPTASANTKRMELNIDVAANQSSYHHENLTGCVA